MLAHCS